MRGSELSMNKKGLQVITHLQYSKTSHEITTEEFIGIESM